jgi:uncharacterized protein
VDTGAWIALLNDQDELHNLSEHHFETLKDAHWVTTEVVLTEFLNHLGSKQANLRHAAARFAEGLRSSPNITIVPQSSTQFWQALLLYSQRLDKEWSLTDCVSFLVMKHQKIKEALAYDRHFEQAGFTALLRKQS